MKIVSSEASGEIAKIKGSRFLGYIAPASSEDVAMAYVEKIREQHPSATHWVFAWRIDPERTRSTDDGEPSGTAGRPLLDRLVGNDLEQTVLVVVRYYGGTKLGTGGLVRAYGAAASFVIDRAVVEEIERRSTVVVEVSARLEGPTRGVGVAHGAEVVDASWGSKVVLQFLIGVEEAAAFAEAVQERAAGQAKIEVIP